MHIKTILNRLQKHKGFVYGNERLVEEEGQLVLEVPIRAHRRSRPVCSSCGRKGPGYDTLAPRRFQFISFWGILVFFVYAMRRVNCPRCGVKVERVPWAQGKSPITTAYAWFLAGWAKRLCWSAVAEAFHASWHHVQLAVEMAVAWGRAHMDLEGITAIGVDELAWHKGHHYATVVYQINEGHKRLLWVGQHRRVKSLLGFFRWLGQERAAKIQFVCSDMWKPYLKVIAKKIPHAIHVLDRFHIMAHMSKAIDRVRAAEAREMKRKGLEPILAKSRWCLLKRVANLTLRQAAKLEDLLQYNLKTVKAYLMKEEFQLFWEYVSPFWAGRFLDAWCRRAMYSKIEPIKEVARMLRGHRELILNWFRAKKEFSSGVVEGLNNKAKLSTRMAYGFGSFRTLEIVLYHRLGDLPEPEFTHKFF
jgi:transposase